MPPRRKREWDPKMIAQRSRYAKRLEKLAIVELGFTPVDVGKYMGVKPETVQRWFRGAQIATGKNWESMQRLFGELREGPEVLGGGARPRPKASKYEHPQDADSRMARQMQLPIPGGEPKPGARTWLPAANRPRPPLASIIRVAGLTTGELCKLLAEGSAELLRRVEGSGVQGGKGHGL